MLPLSWLYGFGVAVRNWLFDIGVLRSKSFSLPVISVGNLTVGGCGKTPHVEYIINLLKDKYRIAVLSRGYKRKSKGYLLAKEDTTMPEIGDEPYQMKQKFPKIIVAVDADRVHGIERLITDKESMDVEAVVLDDAYQHRYVKPGLNILLVDYHRLVIYDALLPAGRLREPISGKDRADIIIVTKCPENMKPMGYRVLSKAMDIKPYQQLFFTGIEYDKLTAFTDGETRSLDSLMPDENILLLTGIASPQQVIDDLGRHSRNIQPMIFADHHQFDSNDVAEINQRFREMKQPRLVVTTEKDAARLRDIKGLDKDLVDNIYVLPIRIGFKQDNHEAFDKLVMRFVESTLAINHTKKWK